MKNTLVKRLGMIAVASAIALSAYACSGVSPRSQYASRPSCRTIYTQDSQERKIESRVCVSADSTDRTATVTRIGDYQ